MKLIDHISNILTLGRYGRLVKKLATEIATKAHWEANYALMGDKAVKLERTLIDVEATLKGLQATYDEALTRLQAKTAVYDELMGSFAELERQYIDLKGQYHLTVDENADLRAKGIKQEGEMDDLLRELEDTYTKLDEMRLALEHLQDGLGKIIEQSTPRPNATVKRMVDTAYNTLYPNGEPAAIVELAEARRTATGGK